jgi:phosphate transport system substrate-binding protein
MRTSRCSINGSSPVHASISSSPKHRLGSSDREMVITGASTLAPLIAEIGKRFESLYPAVRIDVQSGGGRHAGIYLIKE